MVRHLISLHYTEQSFSLGHHALLIIIVVVFDIVQCRKTAQVTTDNTTSRINWPVVNEITTMTGEQRIYQALPTDRPRHWTERRRQLTRFAFDVLESMKGQTDVLPLLSLSAYTKVAEEVLGFRRYVSHEWISDRTRNLVEKKRTARLNHGSVQGLKPTMQEIGKTRQAELSRIQSYTRWSLSGYWPD